MIKTLCLFATLMCVNLLHAQLSGNYLIGPVGADYQDFNSAVMDLEQSGFDGDVTFLIQSGIYSGFTIQNLSNPNEFTISFEYNGPETDSAAIEGVVKLVNTSFISFDGLTFYPEEYQELSCFTIDNSKYISLLNCHLININEVNFDSDEALLKIEVPWDGPYFVINIKDCIINSETETIYHLGKKGQIYYIACSITGIIDAFGSPMAVYYNDNVFHLTDYHLDHTGQHFTGNTFYYDDIFTLRVQGELFYNTFYSNVNAIATDIFYNTFHQDVELKWLNNGDFRNNKVYGELKSSFSHGIKILNNHFYGNVRMNNDNTIFGNNIVLDTVSFTHGPAQLIFHNNFGYNSFLELHYCGGVIQNNNINRMKVLDFQLPVIDILNNNFFNNQRNWIQPYGVGAKFYDPIYTSDSSLYATNPALIKKGAAFGFPYFTLDIDSVTRKELPTIGANELCYDWAFDEIVLKCKDSLCLDLCVDSLEGQYWSPAYLFTDSLSPNPVIYPNDSLMVYLNNIDGSIFDSIHITTAEAMPTAFATYTMDDNLVSFENQSNCADHFIWIFGDGEISTEESPTHQYPTDGIYQCQLTAFNDYGEAHYVIWFDLVVIDELPDSKNDFIIFPNPGKDVVTVKNSEPFNEVMLTDRLGQVVLRKSMQAVLIGELNIQGLSRGVYFVRIRTEKTFQTGKFIKL